MLVQSEQSTNASPFLFKGLNESTSSSPQSTTLQQSASLPESNKEKSFRRAGNVCEIAAGSCLNSAVIFTFHLLQVHPIGMLLAVGTAHLYFTATAAGEQGNLLTNVMTGCSASLALLCSLSEPIGEWWEASTSKNTVTTEIREIYTPASVDYSGWMSSGAIVAVLIMGFLLLRGSR
ncbi:hypothetical protein H6G04_30055 [Calothrix membranacea FACHB-236]|nr:hypothetical protein [Calothrix membranacea FACHB-236]